MSEDEKTEAIPDPDRIDMAAIEAELRTKSNAELREILAANLRVLVWRDPIRCQIESGEPYPAPPLPGSLSLCRVVLGKTDTPHIGFEVEADATDTHGDDAPAVPGLSFTFYLNAEQAGDLVASLMTTKAPIQMSREDAAAVIQCLSPDHPIEADD
jgi:hypothetical protein